MYNHVIAGTCTVVNSYLYAVAIIIIITGCVRLYIEAEVNNYVIYSTEAAGKATVSHVWTKAEMCNQLVSWAKGHAWRRVR